MSPQTTSPDKPRHSAAGESFQRFRLLFKGLPCGVIRIRRHEPAAVIETDGVEPRRPLPVVKASRTRLASLACLVCAGLGAAGADIMVTTVTDENNGSLDPGLGSGTSLREAVLHSPAGSTVKFAAVLDGQTVTLTLGQVLIGKNLSIDASALASGIAVSGNDNSRVFDVPSGKTVTMNRLKIIDGKIPAIGGGIRNAGNLSLTNCELSSNQAGDGGGAIGNGGTLALTACTLDGNTAGVGGGAIEHASGLLTLTNSTLTGNSAQWGGAIDGDGSSTIRLYSCTLSGNHASDKGGGIEETTGTLLLENSIIAGNTATNSGPDLKVSSINTQLGVNLISSTNGLGGSFAGIVASPGLSALGNFGGFTRTMLPQAGSPAIDAGGATALAVDQRGLARVVGPKVDIGAVEIQASLIVTTTADSGPGSLRDTVGIATPGATVLFASALDHATITLTGGEILLDKNLTIDASARVGLAISGGDASRIFQVAAGDVVTIRNLDFRDGYENSGGGFRNAGILTVEDCSLAGCVAEEGGAAFNAVGGVLNLVRCELKSNDATSGGAIFNGGALTLQDCRVLGNLAEDFGGGVFSTGSLTARDSVFTGNGSSFFYAAIYSEHLSMTRCTISWNIAPDNGGGVACNSGDLTACTISSNSCVGNGGGVLHGTGNLTMTQCTVVGNEAFYLGGGICSSGTIRITSCTIQGNDAGEEGGGIHVAPSGQLILENSIVAGNRSFIDGPDILGSIQTEAGVNLLGSTSGLTGSFSGIVGEPDLMPLADYGGPTFTMLPTPGSPVIDAGGPTALTTDQRGLPRVVAALDIGAVEVQPPLVVTNTGDGTPGSLRDLLSTAPNGSTITFDPSLDGSEIRVGSLVEDMPLVIDTNVVIDATGLERLVLRPAGHTSLLRVKVGSVAWIGGLDFEGSWGTAIRNAGDLTLDDCKMVDNTLTNEGGALFNATGAVVRLKACLLSGNRSYGEGGAAFNEGTMWIHDSVLADNECDTEGGAVFSSGRLEVEDSVFVGNGSYDTGGAVFSTGTLTMARSTAEDNWAGDNGGAIHTSGGAADLSACTLSGNKCFEGEGAGIYQGGGSLTLSQCTITGNLADLGFGGGVSSRGEIRVVSCTIADNTAFFEGGGMDLYPSAALTLANTIVAGNSAPVGPDISGAITSQGGVNLLSSTSGLSGAFGGIVADPLLGALRLNGGPTLTMLPSAGSPAINAGGTTPFDADQRGLARVVGGTADIGAVETGNAIPSVVIVDTTADEDNGVNVGNVSLRDAMKDAPAGSIVSFAPSLNGGTINLTVGSLGFGKNMIIDATSLSGGVTVTGSVIRGFEVGRGRHARIAGLSVSGIESPFEDGAAILNSGGLDLVRCTVSGNIGGEGAGLYNSGRLRMSGCTVKDNDTILADGGGLLNSGEAELTGCRFEGNGSVQRGAGIFNRGALRLSDCTFSSGFANAGGGGLSNDGTLVVERSTFSDNSGESAFGGAIDNSGDAEVVSSTIANNLVNSGGGGGGGIWNTGKLLVRSSTISGNRAGDDGGGVYNSGQLSLENSIVAGNTADGAGPDIFGPILSQIGVNLLGTTSGVTVPFTGIVANPMLAPLANNGGPTRTLLPLPGSPAINAGGPTTLPVDQRGLARVIGGVVDIGSVETGNPIPGLYVDTLADENDGIGSGMVSLRDAIAAADPGSTIYFAPALDGGRIILTVGSLAVGKDLVIDASSLPGGIEVSGNGNFRVFDIQTAKTVAMRSLGIIFGRVSSDGGGIRNAGNLTLTGCAVSSNNAGDDGGGILNTGTLALSSSRLDGNYASDSGGAIVSEGVLSLSACEMTGNRADNGGAIFNDGGILSIDGTTLSGNQAEDTPGGGAIDNDNGGEVTLTRSTLSGNTSTSGGGAIENDGTLTILACTLSGNTAAVGGGAIEHAAGILNLTSSTLANNSAQWGGAIDGDGSSTIRLYSTTVSRNHASDKGGGIEETTGTLLMENSMVAGNTATNSGPDLKASSINTQLGVNLISSTNGLGGSFAGIVAAPSLSPLGSFGGPTQTMVPLTASPAIDAGGPSALTSDQRGLPRLDGRWVDIGAVEVQNYLLVTTAADSGAGSLRRIIELARAGSLIPFASSLDGATINLTSGPLVIAKNLDIDATSLPRGVNFTGSAARAFDVAAGTQVTMKRLTVSGFESPDQDGAAIRNAGQLEVTACNFNGNTGDKGGALHNIATGRLTLTACVLFDNEAQRDGGGLFNAGSATLVDSVFVKNGTSSSGAGIWNGGILTMTACSLSFNSANTVGGGLDNVGTATVGRCTFSDNISEAGFGGGISNSSTLNLANCTLSGNVSWVDNLGAGIGNSGSLVVQSCTLSANDGGGIHNTAAGTLTLANSIVAGNTGSAGGPDIDGAINTQLGVNLLSTTTGVTTVFTGIVADPLLEPLGVHGGPTLVMPPVAGSPAINAGGATSLATDQRGFSRVVGGTLDIGAVESGNAIPTVVVNTTADENNGMSIGNVSLRDAMAEAPAGALIQFAPSLNSQVVTLTGGQLTAGKNLIVDASALAGGLTLTAEVARGIEVAPGRGLAVFGLTLSGFVPDADETTILDGAAILNRAGYLELSGCLLEDNRGGDGGAIFNGGHLWMEACTLADNESYDYGGGLFNAGNARLTRCNLVSNGSYQRAAGIYNQARLKMSECTLSGGSANFDGGGLVNHFAATAEIDRCTISGNRAEGGYGGGISNAGWLSLTNSTLSDNEAMDGEGGSGIGNSGFLSITSSTVTANFTTDDGGGILTSPAGTLILANSIIAGNTALGSGPDLDGEIWSESGVNLLGSLSGVDGTFTGIVAAPLLGPLANNGGPTATHLPQSGSPAINAGGATTLTVDQRGFTRVVGGTVDIGSVESGVLFSDNFSGPSPLSKYIIENPSPGGAHSPMTIGVNSGELTFDYLGGFGVVGVNLAQKHAFLNTALECDIRFESPLGSDPRSSAGMAWVNGSSANGYLAVGLQLDENRVYIFAFNGVTSTLASGPLLLDRNVNYRTRLQIDSPGLIKAYVNDVLVTSLAFNTSLLPPLMNPNMGGNAQAALRIVHDKFVVRKLD